MRQRPRPSPMQDLYEEKLSARIADLELRIRLLEARFRASAAEEARRRALESGKAVKAVPPRPRPRCPGCLSNRLPAGAAIPASGAVFVSRRSRQGSVVDGSSLSAHGAHRCRTARGQLLRAAR